MIDWFASLLQVKKLQVKKLQVKPLASPRQQTKHKQQKFSLDTLIKRPRYPLISHLNMILLDTSASTLTAAALQQSKAIVNAINQLAYTRRERLSLVSFGNDQVTMLIPPSRPRRSLSAELASIPAGGGTPFRSAVLYINNYLINRQRQQANESCSLFILTDGRSRSEVADIQLSTYTTLIDMECGDIRLKRCREIANTWGADYLHVDMIPT